MNTNFDKILKSINAFENKIKKDIRVINKNTSEIKALKKDVIKAKTEKINAVIKKLDKDEIELLGFKNKSQLKRFIKDKNIIENNYKKSIRKIFEIIEEEKQYENVQFDGRYILYTLQPPKIKMTNEKKYVFNGLTYYQNKSIDIDVLNPRIIAFENKTVSKIDTPSLFNSFIEILKENKEFADYYKLVGHYIDLIVNSYINESKQTEDGHLGFKVIEEELNNTKENEIIINKYITYEQNKDATKINECFGIKLNDYVSSNFKANSCFINTIINYFHDEFDKIKKGSRIYKELTYTYFCELCKIKELNQNMSLTIEQSLLFFKKFNLGLRVINIYNKVIFHHVPEKYNSNINKRVLNILVHNKHCYLLNSNIESLVQIDDDEMNIRVSNKFNVSNQDYATDTNTHLIKDLDDVSKILSTCDVENKNEIRCIFNDDLTKTVFQLLNNKIVPNIHMNSGIIDSIDLNLGKCKVSIKPCNYLSSDNLIINIDDKDTILRYYKASNDFSKGLICNEFLSYYNPQTIQIENEYDFKPTCGYIKNLNVGCGIDERKAYTSKLYNMHEIPVFDYFDIYVKYDNHEIEKYTKYVVKSLCRDIQHTILFGSVYSISYGYKLMNLNDNIQYQIISFCRPSNVVKSNNKKIIDELYKCKISEDEDEDIYLKKSIVNINTGIIEKKYNTNQLTKIFKYEREAKYYSYLYGGSVHAMKDIETNDFIYIHKIKVQEQMINGFRPIKQYIYDAQKLTLWQRYNECINKGLNVIGIKVDCIYLNDQSDNVKDLFNFDNVIGGYKLEVGHRNYTTKLEMIENKLIDIPEYKENIIPIYNEYDTEEINDILEENNILVLGEYAGVGKTTSIKNYGNNTLFITPHNKLGQELRKDGQESITLNKLLGIYGDGQAYVNMNEYDITPYNNICFDEVLMYGTKELRMIALYMQKNNNKKYFATGDICQIQPFTDKLNNIKDKKAYYLKCHSILFPNRIVLKINKRLNNEDDKIKMKGLKHDILNTKNDVIDICKKYGIKVVYKMSDVNTKMNICYFNRRCENVNNHIYKMIKIDNPQIIGYRNFYIGQLLTCVKHYTKSGKRLFVNYEYEIINIDDNTFTVRDNFEGVEITLIHDCIKFFKLPYAQTINSVQGLSYSDRLTLFDLNTPYVTRQHIYVALTRCRDLNNVQVFCHPKEEVNVLTQSKIGQYFNLKIEEYKIQDKKAGRKISKDYVNVKWIMDEFNKNRYCPCCNERYILGLVDDKVETNVTCDRLNNDLDHSIENCRLCCYKCNITRANHYNL